MITALDERVAKRVDFVVAVGGYQDLRRLITYYTTGAHRDDSDTPTPYDKGKWIFALGVSEKLPDAIRPPRGPGGGTARHLCRRRARRTCRPRRA